MFRYVHVSIAYNIAGTDPGIVEPIIEQLSRDWLKYNANSWVLWTDKSTITIGEMLRTKLTSLDHILVLKIDRSEPATGWEVPVVWEWLNRHRDPTTGYVFVPPQPAYLQPPLNVTPAGSLLAQSLLNKITGGGDV